MKIKTAAVVFGVALFISTGAVPAQDSDDSDEMEATMRLMNHAEAELPDAVTRLIELPDAVLDKDPESPAVEASANGLLKANENPRRQEDGFEQVHDARDNAADMAEQAQENQENRGRSQDRPDPPEPPNGPPGG